MEVGNVVHRRITWKLSMVNSEMVMPGIVIDEETRLDQGIRRKLTVRDQVGQRESKLVYRQYHNVKQRWNGLPA